jgi:hypothetical protein
LYPRKLDEGHVSKLKLFSLAKSRDGCQPSRTSELVEFDQLILGELGSSEIDKWRMGISIF